MEECYMKYTHRNSLTNQVLQIFLSWAAWTGKLSVFSVENT